MAMTIPMIAPKEIVFSDWFDVTSWFGFVIIAKVVKWGVLPIIAFVTGSSSKS